MFEDLSVLYLEDEPIVALDTTEHLKSLGFADVVTAFRLRDAVAALEDRKFDIAVLDINVDKGQTSLEFGRKLTESGTVVIFASGSGSEAPSLEKENYAFLHKPFTLNNVTEKLKAIAANLPGKPS